MQKTSPLFLLKFVRGADIEGYEKITPRGYFRSYYSSGIIGIIIFLVISVFIAPMTHEAFHIIAVKWFGCQYTFSMHQSYENGVYGEVTPLCDLNVGETITFLAAGIMGNIFVAIFLSIIILYARKEKRIIWASMTIFAMIGFASDPLFYFFSQTGDIVTILKILDKEENAYMFPYLGYLLMLSLFMYLWSHLSFTIEHKSKLEEEWERIKSLRNRIKRRKTA